MIHHHFFRCACTRRHRIQFYRWTLWCWREGTEAHIGFLMGEYVALMCSELTQWWVSGDLLPAWRQSQKQSHGLKGGPALKPEIDDSWGVRVHECVCEIQQLIICILRYLFMCVRCVCLQETWISDVVNVYSYVSYVCVISVACMSIHTFNKSVYECELYSPDPTAPFCFFVI